jgi:hypothetical protein
MYSRIGPSLLPEAARNDMMTWAQHTDDNGILNGVLSSPDWPGHFWMFSYEQTNGE